MAGRVELVSSRGVRLLGESITYLDPKKIRSDGINFVSHAHMDHLPSGGSGTVLSSTETRAIADLRGYKIDEHADSASGVTLVDSGHILGSRSLLADGVFYTGDICIRNRGFLRGARVPKCSVLITECTFGLPEFVFPPTQKIMAFVNQIISDMYARGKPIILMGHRLGKAQMLSYMFGHWDPIYYHDDIIGLNDLHRTLGIPLKDVIGHTEAERQGLLDKQPWVMIAPAMSASSPFVQRMKSRYNAITVGFSGWAKSSRFAFGRRCDISVPMSDHCDFNELVQLAVDSQAEKIYTIHGFVTEFAASLQKLGFDAQPLSKSSLDKYL